MKNEVPKWADEKLSAELSAIRESGESETVEFKERFPEQASRLAKELAALGTSGGGRLFLGISDNGDLIGIDASGGDARDDLMERAHGIVTTIRPNLRVNIQLAVESQKTILVICIPKQDNPVFYCEHRPYIRDRRRSRPATPDEVKDLVWAHPSSDYVKEIEQMKLQQKKAMLQKYGTAAVIHRY